jgi:nicotinamidase-related amidase
MSTSAKSKKRSKSAIALLLIDVVNHFEFPDGDRILRQALLIGHNIARLKARARTAGIPTIYVNDNFGDWRSERSVLLDHCLQPQAKGGEFVKLVQPDEEDYFILKPMHSAFYQTPLEVLLQRLGTTELILTGLTSNSCITCTAHDANMRNLKLFVPYDCSVARTAIEHRKAMQHLSTMTKANVVTSHNLRFGMSLKKVWINRDKLRTTGK